MALLLWFPLNGTLENKGLSNVTVTENGTTLYTDGKIGKGLSCDGSSNWRVANVTIGNTCSICWWAKTSTDSKMPWVLEANVYSSLNFYYTGGKYCLNTGDSANNVFQNDLGKNITSLKDNIWHHFAVVFDGTKCSLYIDGKYKGKAKTYKSPATSNKKFKIGGDFNGRHAYDFNGMLNDFRLYDNVLSPKEIKEISKGLILHYKLDGNDIGTQRSISSIPNEVELYEYLQSDGTLYIDTGVYGYMNHTYEMEVSFTTENTARAIFGTRALSSYTGYNMGFTHSNNAPVLYWSNNESSSKAIALVSKTDHNKHLIKIQNGKVYVDSTLKGTSSQYSSDFSISISMSLFALHLPDSYSPGYGRFYSYKDYDSSGNLIRNMLPCTYLGEPGMWDTVEGRFYGNIGTGTFILGPKNFIQQGTPIFYDSSGYCNHGTIIGTLTTNNISPRYTASISLNSENNIVTDNTFFNLSQPFTITSWCNFNGDTNQFAINVTDANHGRSFNFGSNGGAQNLTLLFTTSTLLGVQLGTIQQGWHHYAIVYNGSTLNLYRDGTLLYALNKTNVSYTTSITTNIIRVRNAPQSDVRMYVTALSADDIKELYDTSAFVTNQGEFEEYELYEDNLSDVTKRGILETGNFYENGADSNYTLDTDKTRVANNYIISEEFIEI